MNYAWPTAEIAVMGAEGAVGVFYAKDLKGAADPAALKKEKEDEYTKLFANPYQAAKYGYIDDVIEPRNTRFRVIRALQMLATKKETNPAKKHGNIPSDPLSILHTSHHKMFKKVLLTAAISTVFMSGYSAPAEAVAEQQQPATEVVASLPDGQLEVSNPDWDNSAETAAVEEEHYGPQDDPGRESAECG